MKMIPTIGALGMVGLTLLLLTGAAVDRPTVLQRPVTSPPPGSAIAQLEHPRLFFRGADLDAIRHRIATRYRAEFQEFVDLLGDTTALSRSQRRIEPTWGAFNFAFLAAIDPARMTALGFTLPGHLATASASCGRAMEYAAALLPAVAEGVRQEAHSLLEGYPRLYYVPVMTVYDWCHDALAPADRRRLVDALVAAHDVRYADRDIETMEVGNTRLLANNYASAIMHDALGILAFHGDAYPDRPVQDRLYRTFATLWLDRLGVELERLYHAGGGWHEGHGGYHADGLLNLGVPMAMFSPALGRASIASTPLFRGAPAFWAANARPHNTREAYPPYLERYADTHPGIQWVPCRALSLVTGMLAVQGAGREARLSRWLETVGTTDCPSEVRRYGGVWSNAVLYWFLFGAPDVVALPPGEAGLPRFARFGLNQYVLRSGFDADSTLVTFWAPEYRLYGHWAQMYGHFTIHKHGDLVLYAGSSKSGDARLTDAGLNVMLNVVGIHKGGSDPSLEFDGRVPDTFFGSRGISDARRGGRVYAEALGYPDFAFVGYDGRSVWSPATASASQRELFYLTGPPDAEYVVLVDRLTLENPTASRAVWKAWVPSKPVFDGAIDAPRPGLWTSVTARTLEVTNQQQTLETRYFRSPPTHGRLFLSLLEPRDVVLRALGGPGLEYQSGDDDGTTPWGAPPMDDAMRSYLGWGRVEAEPREAAREVLFLAVFQIGDARRLETGTPIERLAASDDVVGGHVRDPRNEWVLATARSHEANGHLDEVAYAIAPVSSEVRHLIAGLEPDRSFRVAIDSLDGRLSIRADGSLAAAGTVMEADAAGVLRFDTHDGTVVPVRATAAAHQARDGAGIIVGAR